MSSRTKSAEAEAEEDNIKGKIGERVKIIRESHENNETQQGLANAIHISKETISQIEQGRSSLTIYNAIAIAKHYGISVDWLCGLTDDMDDSNKTFDCLCKYVKLSTGNRTFNETDKYRYRSLYIDSNFAKLLENLRIIPTVGDLLPEEMKSALIDSEKKKFSATISSSIPQNFIEFALLIPKTASKEDEILLEGIFDLLNQQIEDKLDTIESTSSIPTI